jgi:ABC-2 type transport system permease protein
MRNLLLLAMNTLKVTFRKKFNIVIFFVLPIAALLLSIVMYSNSGGKITIGINNKAPESKLAQDMIDSIKRQGKYEIVFVEEEKINTAVAEGQVECLISIPKDFEESIYKGKIEKINITSIKGMDATAWIQNYVNHYIKNLMDLSKASEGNRDTFKKLYEGYQKQNLKVEVAMVKDERVGKMATIQSIGFLIMFMLIGSTNTAGFILKEKSERTYFRIFSTPVNNKIYIGGNILANMIIVTIQAAIVVLASKYMFNLNTGVTDIQLFTILVLFGLISVSFGILLVGFSKNTYQGGTLSTLIITPTCMMSGCFWPIEFMPNFMQGIANFLPQKWALEAISQLQQGKSFLEIVPIIGILVAFALAFFLIGAYRMRTNDNVQNFI